jgi:hypothetical protein
MKTRLFLACFAVFSLSAVSTRSQTVVTFDDLSETGSGAWLSGYVGLTWSDIACNNAILATNMVPGFYPGAPTNGLSGDFYGMVSAPNVIFNANGNPAEIDSVTNFNFFSAYLTGAWNSNLNIEVEGFNGAQKIYDTIVVASATNATLFTFDYFNIDHLYFNSYGGDAAFGNTSSIFVMDNFMFEYIPEPSSLLLTALGAVTLCGFLKRKRTWAGGLL